MHSYTIYTHIDSGRTKQ